MSAKPIVDKIKFMMGGNSDENYGPYADAAAANAAIDNALDGNGVNFRKDKKVRLDDGKEYWWVAPYGDGNLQEVLKEPKELAAAAQATANNAAPKDAGIITGAQTIAGTNNFTLFDPLEGKLRARSNGFGNARSVGNQISGTVGDVLTFQYKLKLHEGEKAPTVILSSNNGLENRSNEIQLIPDDEIHRVRLTYSATGNWRISFRSDNVIADYEISYSVLRGSVPDSNTWNKGSKGVFDYSLLDNFLNNTKMGLIENMFNTVPGYSYNVFKVSNYYEITVEATGPSKCVSNRMPIVLGETYTAFYVINSKEGVLPTLAFTDSDGIVRSTSVVTKAGKLNCAELVVTSGGNYSLASNVDAPSKYSAVIVLIKGKVDKGAAFSGGGPNAMLLWAMKSIADYQPTEYELVPDPNTKNLANKELFIDNHYIWTNGVEDGSGNPASPNPNNYVHTGFVEIEAGKPLSFKRGSTPGALGSFYDASFTAVQNFSSNATEGFIGVIPAGVKYWRGNVSSNPATRNADKDAYQLEYSTAPTNYEPFSKLIKKINGYKLDGTASDGGGDEEPETHEQVRKRALALITDQEDDAAFKQPTGATTGLSVSGSTVAAGTTTITLTGPGASAFTNVSFGFRQKLWLDAAIRIHATNRMALQLRSATNAVIRSFMFDPAANTVTETVSGTVYAPGNNITMTSEIRVRVFFDVLKKKVRLCVLFLNSVTTDKVEKQQHFFTGFHDLTGDAVTNIGFVNDTGVTGNGFVRGLLIAKPVIGAKGSSIYGGTGYLTSNNNPVPRYVNQEVLEQQPSFWLDRKTGNKRYTMNFAKASSDSADTLSDMPDMLTFEPEIVITDLGITNDIQDGVLTDEQTRANISAIIAMVTNLPTDEIPGAGKILVVSECLPRDNFDMEEAARAQAINLWLAEQTKTNPRLITTEGLWETFLDSDNNGMSANYCDELEGTKTHPNCFGQRKLGEALYAALTNI